MAIVGSVLHGAYGDYYEQMVCLKHYRRMNPGTRLVLFFASEHRWRELRVFDLSFADEVYPASALEQVPVDRFLQFQVHDAELQADVLARLPAELLARFDRQHNLKPWSVLRTLDLRAPENDCGLSAEGQARLPECLAANDLEEGIFDRRFTVGFLWRYRSRKGAVSPWRQSPEDVVLKTKRDLLQQLMDRYGAHVLICGMNVQTTDANRHRIDAKFTDQNLGLDPERCTYLKGLSWGLELEILRRCRLCVVMASGFSEALWMKRAGPTLLVDAPLHYVAKLLWNRMPLFDVRQPSELWFQLRQPHTAARVLNHLQRKGFLKTASTSTHTVAS